ncbi:hypothetical protein ATANTOWER_000307 [Ataeniobius toweri]|uniref:Uncharacterized protein n=1 Tax=Ataeniobius toweri TaxID=208326 RepID=A0ABU7ADP2_9TELE|nr:hypothetical protein [Ataeniobius toweri]
MTAGLAAPGLKRKRDLESPKLPFTCKCLRSLSKPSSGSVLSSHDKKLPCLVCSYDHGPLYIFVLPSTFYIQPGFHYRRL